MSKLIFTQFTEKEKYGDFLWMIHQPEYRDCLFLFNDNEESMNSCYRGGGNAVIRPYNIIGFLSLGLEKPMSAGIPTGRLGRGYTNLIESQVSIDYSIERIRQNMNTYNYTKVFLSVGHDGIIGSNIFNVDDDVKYYIMEKLKFLF